MKKIITLFIFCGLLGTYTAQSQPDYFQGSVKVELTSTGPYAVFYIKLSSTNASLSTGFSGVEFFLTYSNTYTLTFGTIVNNITDFPGISFLYGGQNPWGSIAGKTIEWFYFTGIATATTSYNVGQEYEVFRVPIATASQDFGDLNIEYDGLTYATYLVITDGFGSGLTTADLLLDEPVFYGPETYTGANGSAIAGGSSAVYTIFDKPLVPMVLWQDAAWAGGTGTGNSPGLSDGTKVCYVRDANAFIVQFAAEVDDLNIEAGADLTIPPTTSLTAVGDAHVEDAAGLKITSTATGTGSFICVGNMTYGASGTAVVGTYLSNGGTTFFHQVGPTVDNQASGSGVTLLDFDLTNGNTYAYEWDEPAQDWSNVYEYSYVINTGYGLMLTTNDGSQGTYNQEGSIINESVLTVLDMSGDPTSVSDAYGWNLISNPYSAALDWLQVWTRESAVIGAGGDDLNPTIYIYDDAADNYRDYNASTQTGTMGQFVHVGQGYWAQYAQTPYSANGSVTLTSTKGDRTHALTPFYKDGPVDLLTLNVSGNTSEDILLIAFREDATSGYDRFKDVDKWDSYSETATEAWTMSTDQKRLTQNILPPLGNTHVSVPMSFECHADGEYTITASDIESFSGAVEIYLEDLVTGAAWHDFVLNEEYVFTGSPDDPEERFVVHFFGVTGLDDQEAMSAVQIYSYDHNAYIVNRGNEMIEEYVVYDMMGRELQRGTLPNSTVNKVFIGEVSGYYVVKVITATRFYSEKIFINR